MLLVFVDVLQHDDNIAPDANSEHNMTQQHEVLNEHD